MPAKIATGLGERLTAVRVARGFKKSVLSVKAGLSPAHVGQIESGALGKGVGYETILRIARAVDASVAYLIEGRGTVEDRFEEPLPEGPVLGRHPRWEQLVADARRMRPQIPDDVFRDLASVPFPWGSIDAVDAVLVADLAQTMHGWTGRESAR